MTMSLMMKKAPVGLFCYGTSYNGGAGGGASLSEPLHGVSLKCEEELDGYTEDIEPWSSKHGLNMKDAGCEDLQNETRELLTRFYRSYTGFKTSGTKHRAEPTLNRVVEDLLSKHSITYKGMVQRLVEQVNLVEIVGVVLEQVFSDGVVNWGRVGSVLALGAVVCERVQKEECVDAVADRISSYLSTHQRHWFISNNGWDGFMDFFRVHDVESAVRSTLMAVAGVAGVGVCLVGLMR